LMCVTMPLKSAGVASQSSSGPAARQQRIRNGLSHYDVLQQRKTIHVIAQHDMQGCTHPLKSAGVASQSSSGPVRQAAAHTQRHDSHYDVLQQHKTTRLSAA
jgi:hypothetical protein